MVVAVSPEDQVVLPRDVREALDIRAVAKVSVIAKGGIAYIVPVLPIAKARGLVPGPSDTPPLREKKDRPL